MADDNREENAGASDATATEQPGRRLNRMKYRLLLAFALLLVYAFIRMATSGYDFDLATSLGYMAGAALDPIVFIILLVLSWLVLKTADSVRSTTSQ